MEQQLQELSAKVDELTTLVEENHRLVQSLYRRAKLASYFLVLKWLIIIGLTLGSLYFIQPYLETMLNIYSSIAGEPGKASQASNAATILDFMKSF